VRAKLRVSLLVLALGGAVVMALAGGGSGAMADSQCVPPNCPKPSLPIVTTTNATASSSSVTVHGTVNPNGSAATCYFQFGPTAAYGARTVSQDVSPKPGAGTQTLSASVAGLEPATVFHYELTCANSSGTANGGDRTFTTGGAGSLLALSGRDGFVSARGVAEIFLGCYGSSRCTGSLTLKRGKTVIGHRRSFSIAPQSGAIVHVRLDRRSRHQLSARGRLTVSVWDGHRSLSGRRSVTLYLFR